IPEAQTLSDPVVIEVVNKIKSVGCKIAVGSPERNDISFEPIKNLAAVFLKFGGGMIRGMTDDKVAVAKVRAITNACREFKIQTVAQHVEDPETLKLLKETGTDYAQGYGIAKPAP